LFKVFIGNTDHKGKVRNYIDPYIRARLLRITEKAWDGHLCIRAEFYGFEGMIFLLILSAVTVFSKNMMVEQS
jgi:hypothetical protein